jgi:hypothetical protein
MVTRFTWTNWAKGNVLQHNEDTWQGEHHGYKRLSDPVNHKRAVLSLSKDRWLVVDHLYGKQNHHYALHWLLCDGEYGVQELVSGHGIVLSPSDNTHRAGELSDSKLLIQMGLLSGNGHFTIVRADSNSTRGWRSQYYGDKEPAISLRLESTQPRACFWTFFGFEQDVVQIEGETFTLISYDQSTSINLRSLTRT